MKIGAVSDIHIDINRSRGYPDFPDILIEYLSDLNLDILIIPGDIADTVRSIDDFFRMTRAINVPKKIFVPGNHDIWVNGKTGDGSLVKYYRVLPELCARYEWHYLPGNPFSMGGTAFAGTMGWYDYSTRNPALDKVYTGEDYMRKISPGGSMWMDLEYARFGMTDREVSGLMLSNLADDLESLGLREGGNTEGMKNVVIVSHVVPFMEFIDFSGSREYDYFSAFIGNTGLGKMIDRIPAGGRKLAFFGHTHRPSVMKAGNGTEGYCVPMGYPSERRGMPLAEALRGRVAVVTLDS